MGFYYHVQHLDELVGKDWMFEFFGEEVYESGCPSSMLQYTLFGLLGREGRAIHLFDFDRLVRGLKKLKTWLSSAEAAKALDRDPALIKKWAEKGLIRGAKPKAFAAGDWRFAPEEIKRVAGLLYSIYDDPDGLTGRGILRKNGKYPWNYESLLTTLQDVTV